MSFSGVPFKRDTRNKENVGYYKGPVKQSMNSGKSTTSAQQSLNKKGLSPMYRAKTPTAMPPSPRRSTTPTQRSTQNSHILKSKSNMATPKRAMKSGNPRKTEQPNAWTDPEEENLDETYKKEADEAIHKLSSLAKPFNHSSSLQNRFQHILNGSNQETNQEKLSSKSAQKRTSKTPTRTKPQNNGQTAAPKVCFRPLKTVLPREKCLQKDGKKFLKVAEDVPIYYEEDMLSDMLNMDMRRKFMGNMLG